MIWWEIEFKGDQDSIWINWTGAWNRYPNPRGYAAGNRMFFCLREAKKMTQMLNQDYQYRIIQKESQI